MHVSKRAQTTYTLPTQRDNARLRALEARGVFVWKLHEGDPHLPVPKVLIDELNSYSEMSMDYPGGAGLKDHVASWQTHYKNLGITLPSEGIIPTLGASEAIHIALFITTDPGDEVLVFEPIYSGYQVLASMLGCHLVPLKTTFEDSFHLPPTENWEKCVTEKTRAIILVNPDNPTGRVLRCDELEAIGRFAASHDLAIIVDETYRNMLMSNEVKNPSILELPTYHERTIVLDSISKRYGVPGMRIGALITFNTTFSEQALKYAMSRASTARIEQIISIPLLASGEMVMEKNKTEIRSRMLATVQALNTLPGIHTHTPESGMFIIVKIPGIDGRHFQNFLLDAFRIDQKTVSILPMQDFYLTNNLGLDEIRIATVYSPERMREAVSLLRQALEQFRNFSHSSHT